MGTRNSGKKSDGSTVADGRPPRLLRPRGNCFRCHFPAPASCVCPATTTNELKVRLPSSLVSPEPNTSGGAPNVAKKKRPFHENADLAQARSKSPPSRRQLFRENYSPSEVSNLDTSTGQGSSEAAETSSVSSSSDHSFESSSSHTVEEEAAVPSTSADPFPSTSVSSQSPKTKRRKKKLKSSGRHVCPICSKLFGSPGKLNQHMFSHTGEKPFECDKCLKAFSSKFKLVRHLLIHSDERQYRCHMCDRTFHRKDHLKNHLKVHNPVKKTYRCDKVGCLKVYSSLLSFRKHSAVHAAEEGDLECKMCGKSFASKDEIVYHLKVHAGSRTVKNPSDKKYGCDYCDRRFFTRKDVRRHLVVHTGKRDFLCQFCPHRFGRKDHLVRHIKKSHSNVNVGVKSASSKSKRSRQISNLESGQANVSGASGGKQRTVLRSHGRSKATVSTETQNESGGMVYHESTAAEYVSNVMTAIAAVKSPKEEPSSDLLKVGELIPSPDDSSFHLEHVKMEECHILPDLQPILFTSTASHPSFDDHLPLASINTSDRVDGAVKSEVSLPSLPVGIDVNQFISSYLDSAAVPASEGDAVQDDQHVTQSPVSTQQSASAGICETETSFYESLENDVAMMQFMELSIPITSSSSSVSTADMSSSVSTPGSLPRFQQAFQQQPP